MRSVKQNILTYLFIVFVVIASLAQITKAKSVYVITNIGAGTIKVYDILDDQIQYQATAENLQRHEDGAVGLALDPDASVVSQNRSQRGENHFWRAFLARAPWPLRRTPKGGTFRSAS